MIDTLVCVVMPLVFIALRTCISAGTVISFTDFSAEYIVQGHRFNIYEDIGCFPALYNTFLLYILNFMWPLLIGTISAVYCGMFSDSLLSMVINDLRPCVVLTLWSFAKRRLEFNQFMATNKSLSMSRYLRLMALSMTELLLTVPLAIMTICVNTTAYPVDPWISLADSHYGFSRVEQIPKLYYSQNVLLTRGMEFTRWMCPISGLLVFAYFGFADEAIRHYKMGFWAVAKIFGYYAPAPVPPKYKSA